jgi:hypothetical protein
MIYNTFSGTSVVFAGILACTMAFGVGPVAAEDAPIASDATPEVYKIIAENDQFRVLQATWQPGQEDNFHSHVADRVSVFHTDCSLRLTNPDGTHRDAKPKFGKARARTGKPMASHKAKNTGDSVCIITIVELK